MQLFDTNILKYTINFFLVVKVKIAFSSTSQNLKVVSNGHT